MKQIQIKVTNESGHRNGRLDVEVIAPDGATINIRGVRLIFCAPANVQALAIEIPESTDRVVLSGLFDATHQLMGQASDPIFDEIVGRCNQCGRATFSSAEIGTVCGLTQPDQIKCPGKFEIRSRVLG